MEILDFFRRILLCLNNMLKLKCKVSFRMFVINFLEKNMFN